MQLDQQSLCGVIHDTDDHRIRRCILTATDIVVKAHSIARLRVDVECTGVVVVVALALHRLATKSAYIVAHRSRAIERRREWCFDLDSSITDRTRCPIPGHDRARGAGNVRLLADPLDDLRRK